MTDEETIDAVRAECPDALVRKIGHLWQIALPCGRHAGAREDAISLIHDLMAQESDLHATEPETPTDRLSNGLAALEAAKARIDDRSEPETGPDTPPEAIADLFREDVPYGEQAAKLLAKYASLGSLIADAGRSMPVASDDQRALHSRLHGALHELRELAAVEVVG